MKRFLSVLLAVTMIMSLTLSASAAVIITGPGNTGGGPGPVVTSSGTNPGTGVIRGIDEDNFISNLDNNARNITLNDSSYFGSVSDLSSLEINPGDVIKIPMTGNLFRNVNGDPWGTASTPVPISTLRSADVAVRLTSTIDSSAATITLEGSKTSSYIKIEFSKSPAYFGERFSYSVYLSYRGARKVGTRIPVKGRVEADIIEVDSSNDYVNISKGETVKATTSVRNVELYLGEECTITRNLVRGYEYSGIATTDILAKDESLFNKYRDMEYIYRLETVGLKAEGNIVSFDLDDTYYAYNSNGTYIGTTNKPLPYWTKYYLTSKKYDEIIVNR